MAALEALVKGPEASWHLHTLQVLMYVDVC
jgi:hypothetical protein